jgi:hypothetical protein
MFFLKSPTFRPPQILYDPPDTAADARRGLTLKPTGLVADGGKGID